MDDENAKAAERAKRLEGIRERTKGGCDGESYEDRAWLLSELAAAERVIEMFRKHRDCCDPEVGMRLESYDRGER